MPLFSTNKAPYLPADVAHPLFLQLRLRLGDVCLVAFYLHLQRPQLGILRLLVRLRLAEFTLQLVLLARLSLSLIAPDLYILVKLCIIRKVPLGGISDVCKSIYRLCAGDINVQLDLLFVLVV